MYNVGDLTVYSTQGICRIIDISEKTFSDITKKYYVLQPLNDPKLSISVPVKSDKSNLSDVVNVTEAEEIIASFKAPAGEWIEKNLHRTQAFSDILKKGNRLEMSNIINTLIRKKQELEKLDKKFPAQDLRFLQTVQSMLFMELAISLSSTPEAIADRIMQNIEDTIHA